MRTLAFILLAALTMTACAQRSTVEKFIKKQKKVDGISMEEIDLNSEEFAAQFKVEGEEVEELMAQLELIRILNSDSTASQSVKESFISKAKAALDGGEYTVLINIAADDGENVGVFTREMEDGLINEVVVLVGEKESVTMIYIKGEIDFSRALNSDLFTSMMSGKKKKDCD